MTTLTMRMIKAKTFTSSAMAASHRSSQRPCRPYNVPTAALSSWRGVRHQRSLDRTGGLNKGEFLAHRNVHRSEDETANPTIEGTG